MGLLSFLFGSKPTTQTTGGGLLATGQQQQTYKDYAENEMMNGRQPLTLKDWTAAQQAKQQAATAPVPPK